SCTTRPKQKHRYKKKGAVLKGHTPRTCKTQLSAHSGYKSSQRSLSLLLTTHGATAASATRPTPSSHDDEPLAERKRESSDNQNNTEQLWGEPPPKAPRAVLGEPHQNVAHPNGTQHKPQGQHNGGPKQTRSTPGKNLHQKRQRAILGRTFTRMHNLNDQTTRTIKENTAASRTAEATQASPG
ncbi:hypothetical protein Taro_007582, partial [Colocasia esculenta]|nr:hypothetical protein [Colocasia esculenta]